MEVELVLINGERRTFVVPGHTDSIVHALDRLDDWIETQDGGWVQKQYIVEVRLSGEKRAPGSPGGSDEELQQLSSAANSLADQAADR